MLQSWVDTSAQAGPVTNLAEGKKKCKILGSGECIHCWIALLHDSCTVRTCVSNGARDDLQIFKFEYIDWVDSQQAVVADHMKNCLPNFVAVFVCLSFQSFAAPFPKFFVLVIQHSILHQKDFLHVPISSMSSLSLVRWLGSRAHSRFSILIFSLTRRTPPRGLIFPYNDNFGKRSFDQHTRVDAQIPVEAFVDLE